jgi:hypothetical protein
MQMALQTLGPVFQSMIPMGVVEPFNNLIIEWAKSLDIDPKGFLIPKPEPPPPPPAPADGPPPAEGGAPSGDGGGGAPPPEGPPAQIPPELSPA